MCDETSNCLTRVMDDQSAMHVTCVRDVVQKIQSSLHHIPPTHRHYIANALLNMAVTRMLKEEGNAQTSTILMRLGDYVATNSGSPSPERAVDLTAVNA
jgi:hypothetical protein